MNELLARKTEKGEPIISELEANNLLNELTDEDLIMGIPFNEPKDIADIIIQIKYDENNSKTLKKKMLAKLIVCRRFCNCNYIYYSMCNQ